MADGGVRAFGLVIGNNSHPFKDDLSPLSLSSSPTAFEFLLVPKKH